MRRVGRLLAFVLVGAAALVGGVAVGPAGADLGGYSITRFDVELTVRQDGRLEVTEVIDVVFAAPRHGIYRFIPNRAEWEPDPKMYRVYDIGSIRVEGQGASGKKKTSQERGNKVIRIGDEDETVTGPVQYRIDYTVKGAVDPHDDFDELYWNATGNEWGVPIPRATVRVTVPAPARASGCYAGPAGSRTPCDRVAVDGSTVTFEQTGLQAYQGVTVYVPFAKGAVSPAPQPILREEFDLRRRSGVDEPGVIAGAVAVLVAVAGAVVGLVWRRGRDQAYVAGVLSGDEQAAPGRLVRVRPGPVEYRPPDDLRPALLGTLLDESADTVDVTAIVVDLAVRGYLRIEEIEERQFLFKKKDWRFHRTEKAADDLDSYERAVLTGLFSTGDTVELSDLKNKFYKTVSAVKQSLYKLAVKQGWYRARPDHTRAAWVAVGLVVAAAGVGLTVLAFKYTHAGLVPLGVVLAGLLLAAFAGRMPARTSRGSAMLARVLGFERFIATADADRLRFAEEEHLFEKYLPYAMVFGVVDKWAKAFEGLADVPQQSGTSGWWVSTSGRSFSPTSLGASLGAFSSSAGSTLTSSPSSSGSGGSGGSSGGGGGGGGGGSW